MHKNLNRDSFYTHVQGLDSDQCKQQNGARRLPYGYGTFDRAGRPVRYKQINIYVVW